MTLRTSGIVKVQAGADNINPLNIDLSNGAVACGLPSYRTREFFTAAELQGQMAIVDAFFDDSGDHKRESFVAVGGLIGGDLQFLDFDMFWSSVTSRAGLREPFRSTDCETQHGQFATWNKKDCDALMRELVRVIRRTKLLSFGSIVPVVEYRRAFPGSGEYDPYFLALQHTIINMAFLGSGRGGQPGHIPVGVRICCEDSQATSGRALQVYQELKAWKGWTWHKALVGFSTASKGLMPLQGADLIAREAYKHAANLGIRATRKPVKALQHRMSFHLWNKAALDNLRVVGGLLNAISTDGNNSLTEPPGIECFYDTSFD